jgi:hypothetical protein
MLANEKRGTVGAASADREQEIANPAMTRRATQ